jgi:hypothetical protein
MFFVEMPAATRQKMIDRATFSAREVPGALPGSTAVRPGAQGPHQGPHGR